MMTRRALLIATVIAAGGILAALASNQGRGIATDSPWRETAWPFPRDAWPPGRAFRCISEACTGVELYVRPKVGFCANCAIGVADDNEVDRVTDLDLISEHFVPTEPGRKIQISDMRGRARRYGLAMPDETRRAAVGFAVARKCDLVVAVSEGQSAASPAAERAALDLLSSNPLMTWIDAALGGS